jgi:hypothetical protein
MMYGMFSFCIFIGYECEAKNLLHIYWVLMGSQEDRKTDFTQRAMNSSSMCSFLAVVWNTGITILQ